MARSNGQIRKDDYAVVVELPPSARDLENKGIKHLALARLATKRTHVIALPSATRYFNGNVNRFLRISFGHSLRSKLKLLGVAILESVPNSLRKRFCPLNDSVSLMVEHLCKNLAISSSNSIYTVNDKMALTIVGETYESYVNEHLKMPQGSVFMDVGAHVGKYTILAARILGFGGLVVAVEANSNNFATLRRNIKLNGLSTVVPYNIAAWNKQETLKFNWGGNSASFAVEDHGKTGTVAVSARLLDDSRRVAA